MTCMKYNLRQHLQAFLNGLVILILTVFDCDHFSHLIRHFNNCSGRSLTKIEKGAVRTYHMETSISPGTPHWSGYDWKFFMQNTRQARIANIAEVLSHI